MWDERAKAAIDRSRNGSTGSAIMAQLLAAANTGYRRDLKQRSGNIHECTRAARKFPEDARARESTGSDRVSI